MNLQLAEVLEAQLTPEAEEEAEVTTQDISRTMELEDTNNRTRATTLIDHQGHAINATKKVMSLPIAHSISCPVNKATTMEDRCTRCNHSKDICMEANRQEDRPKEHL